MTRRRWSGAPRPLLSANHGAGLGGGSSGLQRTPVGGSPSGYVTARRRTAESSSFSLPSCLPPVSPPERARPISDHQGRCPPWESPGPLGQCCQAPGPGCRGRDSPIGGLVFVWQAAKQRAKDSVQYPRFECPVLFRRARIKGLRSWRVAPRSVTARLTVGSLTLGCPLP